MGILSVLLSFIIIIVSTNVGPTGSDSWRYFMPPLPLAIVAAILACVAFKKDKENLKREIAGAGMVVSAIAILLSGYVELKHADEEFKFTAEEITATRGRISAIENACDIYSMRHNGRYPDSLNELVSGTDAGDGLPKDEITDSWDKPFQYMRHGREIVIISGGPDLKMGTDDDISNQ